jgi:FMN-dependent NADH-azoreductase
MNILRIDSSAKIEGSHSRDLIDGLLRNLEQEGRVVRRDLVDPIPQIDAAWIAANTTPDDERTDSHRQTLALSDALVGELEAADLTVIGLPVYNFGVPAALKAWIDQVCRARRTFRYSPDGPVGLLEGKRAIVVYAAGGTAMGSDIDFASGYLRHVLGFIGVKDVTFVDAGRHMADADAISRAEAEIDRLAADLATRLAA